MMSCIGADEKRKAFQRESAGVETVGVVLEDF